MVMDKRGPPSCGKTRECKIELAKMAVAQQRNNPAGTVDLDWAHRCIRAAFWCAHKKYRQNTPRSAHVSVIDCVLCGLRWQETVDYICGN